MDIPEALKSCPESEYGQYLWYTECFIFIIYIFCKNQVKKGLLHGLKPLILKDFTTWYGSKHGTDLCPDMPVFLYDTEGVLDREQQEPE